MGLGKVDLHLHLDGSLDLTNAYMLAKERDVIDQNCTFDQFTEKMVIPDNNPSLYEYLQCFKLPIAILQDKKAIIESVLALVKNLADQGLIYAEIRFAPQFFTEKGMTQEEVVQAALEARFQAAQLYPSIKINFILCMMTIGPEELNHDENVKTLNVAKKFYNKGIVAVDIAGAEGISPLIGYKSLFDMAKEMGLRYTIHAGEAGPASNVEIAIMMGASRIGHGGHCTLDPRVKQIVIDQRIPLEMCPTSNIHCRCQPSYEQHALVELFKEGAQITLNTDNMTLSYVTLEKEVDHALNEMGLSKEDIQQITRNSIHAAFIDDQEKESLFQKLN